LFGILLRFREGIIGITADICEMFHQIKIIERDQHYLLILWRDCNVLRKPDIYKMTVMPFGARCSPSCAKYIKNLNAKKFEERFPRAVAILERHYVDDLLDSVNTKDEAIELTKQIKYIHEQGGFNIRNWISNDQGVVAAIEPLIGKAMDVNLNFGSESGVEKVLFWETRSDCFVFNVRIQLNVNA
jgi:hypothetical protein